MQILALHTESPYWDQALRFAEMASRITGGACVLLGTTPEPETAEELRETLASTLSPDVNVTLKIRCGEFYHEVLDEIQEGDYDLALIGADPPVAETPYHVSTAEYLAQCTGLPLGIVRSCPTSLDRVLVCARSLDPDAPTIRQGAEIARSFSAEATVLHVEPPSAGATELSPDLPTPDQSEGMEIRRGPIASVVQAKIDREGIEIAIVGAHDVPSPPPRSGPTLAQPDITHQLIQLKVPVVFVVGQPTLVEEPELELALAERPQELRRVLRFAAIELLIYAVLVIAYGAVAFRFLVTPLTDLFNNNLILYAIVALLLIVGQGLLLEMLTSFLMDRLRLERFE